jgi:hypothetical protein
MQCIPAIVIKKLTITVHPKFINGCNFGPDVLIQLPEHEVWLHALGFQESQKVVGQREVRRPGWTGNATNNMK